MKSLATWCINAFFILAGLRLLARPPDASDPPEMHAFYHRWLQPSVWTIFAPLVLFCVVVAVGAVLEVVYNRYLKDD